MGEGGQDVSSPDNVKEVQLPDVHKSLLNTGETEPPRPPCSLYTAPIAVNSNDQNGEKFPIPESPVIYGAPDGSQLSTSSNSPAIWRHPGFAQCSSVSTMNIDYLNNQGFPIEDGSPFFYHSQKSSPMANTSNFKGTDSASLVPLPLPLSLDTKSNLTDSTSAILPICRICHMPGDESEILISPCRCVGTVQFIHNTCLMVSYLL